ncbi:uncharacterized protein DDB_G0281497-like [Drosophila innubila]|uniref:uncharacterized protein DDB_G0281497-like n=1 Tax=Drosophila innubila TaxID=198719 RepID=UPI00148B7687|nr:uncharacterized protein DDB_G0281497-like [Drosophila innubila]
MNSPQLVNTAAQAHHSSGNNNNNNNSNSNSNNLNTQTSANKFAPARRLAARQTLRLAIPKQQGDSVNLPQSGSIYRQSPSHLPPAPLLKRHTTTTATSTGGNSFIPKTASPLESHKLPNATPSGSTTPLLYNGNPGSASSSSSTPSANFLAVRKPSLTLNSSDIRNNNDLFAFAKDMSPALELTDHTHSPMFTDISTAISPANSNGSPTPSHHHQLGRLFSLSPNSMRSYGNL